MSPKPPTSGSHNLRELLDLVLLMLSPMALLMFLVLVVVTLDSFGSYVQMIQAIDADGVPGRGKWLGIASNKIMGSIEMTKADGEKSYYIIYTKYYKPETLAALREGQEVNIRYIDQPQRDQITILSDASDELHAYTGYVNDKIPFLLGCWLVLIVHPEILFFGLTRAEEKQA